MKKLILLLVIFAYTQTFSQEVDIEEAKKVSENYYNHTYISNDGSTLKSSSKKIKAKNFYIKKYKNHNSYYVFNMESGGWVILSSHKAMGPILAHSDKGEIHETDVPEIFKDWMLQYELNIDYAYKNQLTRSEKLKKWEKFSKNEISSVKISRFSNLKSTSTEEGFYLLDSEWGQTSTNDYACPSTGAYNSWMPQNCENNCGGRAAAGCVAVAIAQIMNYWKFATGDYADFEWWNMPNELNYYGNPNYEIQKNAISYLLKRVGDRVSMDYGCSSSADPYEHGIYAFREFGYNEDDMDYERCWTHTYNAWVDDLKTELNNGRPVLYRYVGKHTFICDGFQPEHSFHFNLGWKGLYDGFYDYEDLKVDGAFDFTDTDEHASIIGIHPNMRSLWKLQNVSISTTSSDKWPKKITYQAQEIIAAGGNTYFVVNSNADCHLIASGKINILPGFKVSTGGTFLAYSLQNSSLKSASSSAHNESNQELKEKTTNNTEHEDVGNFFEIYPNPITENYIKIIAKKPTEKELNVEIFNSLGNKIKQVKLDQYSVTKISFENLSQGIYYLRIKNEEKAFNFKVIKQ